MTSDQDQEQARTMRPGAILMIGLALLAMGVVTVASASASIDRSLLNQSMWQTPFGRQAVFAAVGVLVMLVSSAVARPVLASVKWRNRAAAGFFVVVVLALAATFVPALTDAHRGSERWLKLGIAGLSFQPSELAKPALVLALAAFLSRPDTDHRSFWRGLVPAAGLIGVVVLLVGKENLGTAALLVCIGFATLMAGGCRLLHLVLLACVGVAAMVILLFAEEYRLERITSFQNMWNDPRGGGYQPMQSLITIASGGWWGVGLGAGVQKYGYLPESRTDFIFSVLCEEMGFIGGCVVLALFAALLCLGARTMWTARTGFTRVLAFGLSFAIVLQAIVNVAVVTVLTPTTGVALPLISAGGSGTVTYCFVIGLLAAVASLAGRTAPGGLSRSADPERVITFPGTVVAS